MNLRDLCKIVPASYRQLDYWRRNGWIGAECANPGPGTGKGELSPTCLKRALILATCHSAGVNAREVAAALDKLEPEELTQLDSNGPSDEGTASSVLLYLEHGVTIIVKARDVVGWEDALRPKETS